MSVDDKAAARKGAENRCPRHAKPEGGCAAMLWRTCLSCKKRFPSEGAHNRLCELCRRSTDFGTFDGPYKLSN